MFYKFVRKCHVIIELSAQLKKKNLGADSEKIWRTFNSNTVCWLFVNNKNELLNYEHP